MTAIIHVHGRQILDSRGNPTVEVEVVLEDGSFGRAAVPSGASTGAHEAVENARRGQEPLARQGRRAGGRRGQRRDRRRRWRAARPRTRPRSTRRMIELDGTANKARLGANAILGVSLAVAKAAADARGLPLYRYVGGVSARRPAGADDEHRQRRRPRRQSDRLPGVHDRCRSARRPSPRRCAAAPRSSTRSRRACTRPASPPRSATRAASRPTSPRPATALDFIMRSIEQAGYKPGDDVILALDCAATEFFSDGAYRMEGEGQTPHRRGDGRLSRRARRGLSDRLDRGRHGRGRLDGWKALTDRLGDTRPAGRRRPVRHQPKRLAMGIEQRPRQFDPGQGQPDRHPDRDAGGGRDRPSRRLHRGDVAPLGRDRGHHHRRPRGRHQLRADQDRQPRPLGPARQVQPAAPDRGGARGRRLLSGAEHLPRFNSLIARMTGFIMQSPLKDLIPWRIADSVTAR